VGHRRRLSEGENRGMAWGETVGGGGLIGGKGGGIRRKKKQWR
jgi:hypothetical protein